MSVGRTWRTLRSERPEDEMDEDDEGDTSSNSQVAGFSSCSRNFSCVLRIDLSPDHMPHTLSLLPDFKWILISDEDWDLQILGDLPSLLEVHHLLTLVSFWALNVCRLCGLAVYTGSPDVTLAEAFSWKLSSGSSDSDCFWFCITTESVSHENKLVTQNVNFFTGKARSSLVSHKVFGRMKWREYKSMYYLSIPHYGAGACRDSTYTKARLWSNMDYVFAWVILPVSMVQ